MECRKVVELIPLMAGNDLGESAHAGEFNEHLTACVSCKAEMNEYKEIISAISTLKAPALSGADLNAMWNNVSPEIEVPETPKQTVKLPLLAYAAVLVAGLSIGFAALVLIDRASPEPQPTKVIVQSPSNDGLSGTAAPAVGSDSKNPFRGMNTEEFRKATVFVMGGVQQIGKLQAENEKMRREITKLTEKIDSLEKQIVEVKKGNSQDKDK